MSVIRIVNPRKPSSAMNIAVATHAETRHTVSDQVRLHPNHKFNKFISRPSKTVDKYEENIASQKQMLATHLPQGTASSLAPGKMMIPGKEGVRNFSRFHELADSNKQRAQAMKMKNLLGQQTKQMGRGMRQVAHVTTDLDKSRQVKFRDHDQGIHNLTGPLNFSTQGLGKGGVVHPQSVKHLQLKNASRPMGNNRVRSSQARDDRHLVDPTIERSRFRNLAHAGRKHAVV